MPLSRSSPRVSLVSLTPCPSRVPHPVPLSCPSPRVSLVSLTPCLSQEADRDGDGEINEEEFLRIMKKTSLY